MRSILPACIFLWLATGVNAKVILQGTVSFLNSGSRPAAGVKISAFGANECYSTDAGMFRLEFLEKKPGDKVKIMVGSNDKNGIAIELVNDKVIDQVRIPSNSDDDIVEIIVCKIGQRNDAALRYNGLIVKTINEAMEKRLSEIDEKLGLAKINAETIMALQNEKLKLVAERDSAVDKAEEQALYIASINLDNASQLVRDAVLKIDSLQDIPGAIAVLDNEELLKIYVEAKNKIQKGKIQVNQIIEGFKLKIKLLGLSYQNMELNTCCKELEKIYIEQNYDLKDIHQCFEWTSLDERDIEKLNDKLKNHQDLDPKKTSAVGLSCSAVGDIAIDFSLKNVNNNTFYLSNYQDGKEGIIVVFTCNSCPIAQLYEQRIIDLHLKFAPLGYPVVAINPNSPLITPADSYEKMQERARIKDYPFVYLFDEDQTVFPKFGVTRTPTVFILDANRVVRYIGAIDDNADAPNSATNRWVENAVYALLRGEIPNPDFTRPIGCTIKKDPTITNIISGQATWIPIDKNKSDKIEIYWTNLGDRAGIAEIGVSQSDYPNNENIKVLPIEKGQKVTTDGFVYYRSGSANGGANIDKGVAYIKYKFVSN